MRYLGIDYGTKRIGIAISDESGSIAFPNSVIPNTKDFFPALKEICKKEGVGAIVIGESKDYGGRDNDVMKEIRLFADKVSLETGLNVNYEQEFGSSHEATRFQIRRPDSGRASELRPSRSLGRQSINRDTIDSSAATIILQRFLEKVSKK